MATKAGKPANGGAHTAGIYSDITVDGPEIGTLVVIVDRAKNLPNRKSMGKQDPYCAARLGKEAKKTETDKRGGQTPKWDQELRFNVHDSPDYYQLKVSVFNDDRKTELIGETWVALELIIIPGGGQNDVWHTLNCKGRYAGEIRIELTYYDTRPREGKPEKRRLSAPIDATVGQVSSGVSGPRQPKTVRRRPLPADPTDSSGQSSLPYLPPDSQQHYPESPDSHVFEATPPPDRRHERMQNNVTASSPFGMNQQQHQSSHSMDTGIPSPHHQPASTHFNVVDPVAQIDYGFEDSDVHGHGSEIDYQYEEPASYEREYPNDWQSRPLTQPLQSSQGVIHSLSSPAMIDARPRQSNPRLPQVPQPSPPKSYAYDQRPNHQYPLQGSYDTSANTYGDSGIEEEAPPPPPVHRNSGSRPSIHAEGRGPPDQSYNPIPATAPLNVRNGRGSITGSPLSHSVSNLSNMGYPPSTSPSNSQAYTQPPPSVSSRTSYSMLRNQRSQSPMRDYGQSMPPSLVPGYEPSIAEDESERLMHEKRMSARHHASDPPRPQLQQAPLPIETSQSLYQQPSSAVGPPRPQYQYTPDSLEQSRPQTRARNLGNVQERRAHRSSAPIIQPQSTSSAPRTPVRKSVSPQPDSAPAERRTSEIPFSPDSFDAFNPSINAASNVNELGARYNTPEQAKEAARQHERQQKLGDGPIIGNDGRIIDPSDHLPTDTWAPEPEQKAPKKGPQVTMRFRHSPQGAQPMLAARRPTVEHSVSTPVYAHSPDNTSPDISSRSRLQKKPRAATGQPQSSPLVPTLNNPSRNSPLRASESNYPLRERENHGGYGSSPTYGRPSPGNIPPPLPGKIPIDGGQEDWDTSALSEEMKRIDIGVGGGGGQGRQRRGRFGV